MSEAVLAPMFGTDINLQPLHLAFKRLNVHLKREHDKRQAATRKKLEDDGKRFKASPFKGFFCLQFKRAETIHIQGEDIAVPRSWVTFRGDCLCADIEIPAGNISSLCDFAGLFFGVDC